jgi:hypothetical protein
MPSPLIFPLNRLSPSGVAALQFGVRSGARVIQPAFMQQRAKAGQGLLAPRVLTSLPWNTTGLQSVVDVPMLVPAVIHQLIPYPPTYFRITGTTRNSTGAALGTCVVDMFDTATDVRIDTTTSDATGVFEFRYAGQPPTTYYLVAYKAGSPDVAGTTVNTLVGT